MPSPLFPSSLVHIGSLFSYPSPVGFLGRISVPPSLLSPTWSMSGLQEIYKSLTWQTLGGRLIQCLRLSLLPAIGSSPGCLCCQLSWAEGRASPLSHPNFREPLPDSPSGPVEALTLVLKEGGCVLTPSLPWGCGIQNTAHVKDSFLSNSLLTFNFLIYL